MELAPSEAGMRPFDVVALVYEPGSFLDSAYVGRIYPGDTGIRAVPALPGTLVLDTTMDCGGFESQDDAEDWLVEMASAFGHMVMAVEKQRRNVAEA